MRISFDVSRHNFKWLLPVIFLATLHIQTPFAIADPAPEGYVSLISESGLDGWRGDLASWTVVDEVLIGRADGTLKSNRFIVADIDPVVNFDFQVDVWISSGGNSGLQYRSEARDDLGPAVVTGYQCDVVANNPNYNGMLYEERGRRILAHTGEKVVIDAEGQPWVVGKFPVKTFAAQQWHRYRVLVEGNHHRHWIDETPTVDVVDLDQHGRSLRGVLGVQVHVGPPMEVRYKNFHLKRLPDEIKILTADDVQIPADAVKVVPQGGWKRAGQRDFNAKLVDAELGDTINVHRCGDVWLAGQPPKSEFAKLKQQGVQTVITIRTPGELTWDEQQIVESAGLKYVALPFLAADELSDEIFDRSRELLRTAKPGEGILLHCGSASRVGAVWLVHRVLDGRMAIPEARKEAARVGLRSPAFEEKALDYLRRKGRK